MLFILLLTIDRALDEYKLRNYLENFNKTYPHYLKSYTFISKKFEQIKFAPNENNKWLSTLNGFTPYRYPVHIYAIEENFLETCY